MGVPDQPTEQPTAQPPNQHDRPHDPAGLPRKPTVDPATFFALDLRAGVVTAVDAFPEARRPAWKLTVDFGPVVGTLRTSAQVTNYTAEELVGRRVVGAVNLGPKRIAGFASEFLVLGALASDGAVTLLDVDHAPGASGRAHGGDDIAPGAPVA